MRHAFMTLASEKVYRQNPFAELRAQLAVGHAHNMTVSWRGQLASISGAAEGLVSMMVVMLVAGIGLVLAGLLATGYGISIKEFSTGNTLIITGVMAVCTGAMMLALWMAVRELKTIARRLGADLPEPRGEVAVRPVLPPGAMRDPASGEGVFPSSRDLPRAGSAASSVLPPPWQDEAVLRDHPIP